LRSSVDQQQQAVATISYCPSFLTGIIFLGVPTGGGTSVTFQRGIPIVLHGLSFYKEYCNAGIYRAFQPAERPLNSSASFSLFCIHYHSTKTIDTLEFTGRSVRSTDRSTD
jgi:hypothetical protein